MTEITQADRDAAEAYREKVLSAIWEGKPEEPVLLEAFARHRMEERDRIIDIINKRIDIAKGFINGCMEHEVQPAAGLFGGLTELRSLLRELNQ